MDHIFKPKQISVYLLILMVLTFTNCGKRFVFEPDLSRENEIVITGAIHSGPGPYLVSVERLKRNSTDITEIQFAYVKILDDIGNEERCFEVKPGVYQCDGLLVSGQPGRSYSIEIILENNMSYRSLPDRMPTVKGSDFEVTWKETQKITTTTTGTNVSANIIKLSILSNLPQSNEPYQLYWRGEELYQFLQKQITIPFAPPPPCYITDDVAAPIQILNSRENIGSELRIENFGEREIDDTFLRKHIFSIYQTSISEEYFQYLKQIRELTENVGSIFDTPKGLIRGNIVSVDNPNEIVHGFFRAIQADTVHIAIFPPNLVTKPRDRCEITRPGPNCFGCPRGTFDRPGLFDKVN